MERVIMKVTTRQRMIIKRIFELQTNTIPKMKTTYELYSSECAKRMKIANKKTKSCGCNTGNIMK
jgi:hypothetical protein